MSKRMKIWLIVAASLVLLGGILFCGVMTVLGWDFRKLSTVSYETNQYEINEAYADITLVTNTADVDFVLSENGKTEVVCHEQTNVEHAVSVKDGTLVIERVDTRKWYEHLNVGSLSTKVTVSLPAGAYGALSVKVSTGDVKIAKDFSFASIDIKATTGDISLENLSADSMALKVSTGRITLKNVSCAGDVAVGVSTGKAYLTDVTCKNLSSEGDTGDLTLKNVVASEKFSIERGTGDVTFEACDAAELSVKTDTGDVEGTLCSDKIFITHTDTGRVEVPASVNGGRCEITTDTGSIKIQISS